MKNVFRISGIILLILLIYSCKKEESKQLTITKTAVTGLVQKGPYINGTSISMFELSSSLAQTGNIFTTTISNNIGSFEINNVSLTSSYVEFLASGYYFDEVKGGLSVAPLTLYALSDITDISTVNVNILTHLEKQRVDYLVKQNKTLSEAKKIAQGEILAIFGFSLSGINNSESLDISVNNEGNAILLAISIILQGNRSVGDLTELLANITSDISEDGILDNNSIMTNLRNSTKELVLSTIRTNLVNRYQSLGISASIPGFEKYINDFLAFTAQKPETATQAATNLTATSATLNGTVNANSLSTTVTFEYGISDSYGSSVTAAQSPLDGSSFVAAVSADITRLSPATLYHFRIKAENSLGIIYGNDSTFTTLGRVPSVTTKNATNIATTGATLNGIVNSNSLPTTVTFEYGLSDSYGSSVTATQSPLNGSSSANSVSADITGLLPATLYHFRITAVNELGTTISNDATFSTFVIGADYQGGKIAYIFQPGDFGYIAGETHGLIAAPADQSTGIQWYNGIYMLTGATATAIGTGRANTDSIVAHQGAGSYAAELCNDLELGGYSDWFLPSIDELHKLALNQAAIGGFHSDPSIFYWSSSEENLVLAKTWTFYFFEGINNGTINKCVQLGYVRAVRVF